MGCWAKDDDIDNLITRDGNTANLYEPGADQAVSRLNYSNNNSAAVITCHVSQYNAIILVILDTDEEIFSFSHLLFSEAQTTETVNLKLKFVAEY